MRRNVTWRGHTAAYTPAEQRIMAHMRRGNCTADEIAFIHEAKARFNGRLKDPTAIFRRQYKRFR
jgi:hypothetical protein